MTTADRIVLVVTDAHDATAGLVAELSSSTTHRIRSVPTIEQAGEVADGPDEVDAVVLDLDSLGTDATESVRHALRAIPHCPVVALAADGDPLAARDAVAAGADDLLVTGRADGSDLARALGAAIERHRSRSHLADALHRLEDANRRLQRMRDAQEEFIAIASHELRTPVTIAAGFVRLLAERWTSLDAQQRDQMLVRSVDALARLEVLTDDLLTVARSDASATPPTAVALTDAIAHGVSSSLLDEDVVDVEVEVGVSTWADPVALARVVRNLLDNAAAHGRPPVRVRAWRAVDGVVLSVEDHGDGVPGEFVDQMFDRFSQAAPSMSRPHGGSGLGLAIVESLVRTAGGRISYERAPHGGARFVVVLPADAPQDEAAHSSGR